jgi:hypothetical protein
MQISFSTFVLLASMCIVVAIASSISSNKRDKRMLRNPEPPEIIVQPWPYPFQVCGFIGFNCTNETDCCNKNACGYPSGYDYDTTRCCGQTGATGCKINSAGFDSGCCVHSHHCEWRDATKKTTWCMPTLYKKKRTIESFIFN